MERTCEVQTSKNITSTVMNGGYGLSGVAGDGGFGLG